MTQPAPPQSTRKTDAGRVPGIFVIPNTFEIIIAWLTPGPAVRTYHTKFHARSMGSFSLSQANADNVFGQFASLWQAHLALYSPTGYLCDHAMIRDMSNSTNPVFVTTGNSLSGTSASPAMPETNAIVMTENINGRGRGAKGRVYLPNWATNADAGAGTINPAVQTAINDFGAALMAGWQSLSLQPVVAKPPRLEYVGVTGTLHQQRGTLNPPPPTGFTLDVVAFQCRDVLWDTQRKRGQA